MDLLIQLQAARQISTWFDLGQLHRDEEQERLERQYEHSHWEDIRSSATGEELLNMVNIIKLQVSA